MSFRLSTLFARIEGWFEGPEAKAAEQWIENMIPFAKTIIDDIAAAAPNRTTAEFAKIADTYVLPTVNTLVLDAENPTSPQAITSAQNIMQNLGAAILAKNHAPTADTNLLNTVISLAVTGTRTSSVPPAHLIGNGAMGGAPIPTPA